ncbi:hypothetical protein [Sorangium sp. So ce542]|uniref:hypothetical protein n=1 Tax=Sorangium sp. So ce542 TaxID=3133316 RepID=UPI003F5DE86D
MAAIQTIDPRSSLEAIYADFLYTAVRLRADQATYPALAPLVAAFEAFEQQWLEVSAQERALLAAVFLAEARVERADDRLNFLSDAVSATLLVDLKGKRTSTEYTRYFGTQRPSDFKRPLLGDQLTSMRTWPPSLKESQNPTLKEYGARLEAVVAEADAANKEQLDADQKLTDFRISGVRKVLVDRFNALRKSTYGELAKFAHDHPELKLPNDFAGDYFRRESAPREPSVAELDRRIAAAEAELNRLRSLRDAKMAAMDAEAKAKAEAERAAKQAKLAAARKLEEELKAQVAQLQAELGG